MSLISAEDALMFWGAAVLSLLWYRTIHNVKKNARTEQGLRIVECLYRENACLLY